MAENFDLIFGQNASQQYAWNDTDYQNGWETIGNIPPTAAQFDALQRRADTKAQELNSRLITVEESIVGGAGQKREADTAYAAGDVVTYDGLPMDWVLVCIVGGTTGSADIILPSPRVEGARILDGTVTWALRKIATYGGIGYRQSSTSYYTGAIAFSTALPTGWYLECTGSGGITSASDLVITSPAVGDTVTDGTVVWTIHSISAEATTTDKGLLSPSDKSKIDNIPASGGTGFNHREVITTSGTWTAPTSGYYKVTCIGGGGAGGSNGKRGGKGGGTTSFGSYLSAIGGGGGGGGPRTAAACGSGGGGAGKVTTTYVRLTESTTVTCTIGAGGVISTTDDIAPTGEGAGCNYSYYANTSTAYGAHGAGNGQGGLNDSGGTAGGGGHGGSNGTGYGGGGGGACGGTYGWRYGGGGNGADNGSNGNRPSANGGTAQLNGGNGGNGAIIIEYYLNE